MPDKPIHHVGDALVDTPADLRDVADSVARDTRSFLSTVTEVAAGSNPEVAIPLLLLAVSDVLAAGARLGAMVDVLPAERFEPDVGPDADLDPLRAALENVLDGIDDYTEIDDPVLGVEVVTSSVSGDLVMVAGALSQGLRHYEAGQVIEALWWWQYSYLANWGERGSAVLRVLQTILAHLRLDIDEDTVAEAEFHALHP
ncbi:DUF5063 domain-containing protein [Cellulomonas sp. KRMCY2]|uniref:DUF5063 domain-containing protein n=1 Tax=Cellulomonas sp. KRMCY2 TaxID=1304865 RepID=UPI001E458394|nr:DUF5063 domain-containing protein [Cellulomonas sp. KRMCY2]